MYNEGLHDLYCSPNNTGVIKWRRIGLVGCVVCVGRREICTGFWLGNLKERDILGNLDIAGRKKLK